MSHESYDQDIIILRPLLNIYKKEIYNFAYEFNIPHVYDSTPSWSERGKMRDILIPQINNFNDQIIDGLYEMSKNFHEIYKIYKNCLPEISFNETFCKIINKDIYFFDYWKNIFNNICNYYKITNIKNKGIQYFIENIKFGNKITLSKNIIAIKKNDILFYINKQYIQ